MEQRDAAIELLLNRRRAGRGEMHLSQAPCGRAVLVLSPAVSRGVADERQSERQCGNRSL